MKKIACHAVIALCLLASCKRAPQSDEAVITNPKEESKMTQGETYAADLNASKVEWVGTKVTGYHTGTIKIKSGELSVVNGDVKAGKFVIDMTTIEATGPSKVKADASAKLTGHLKSPDFFDSEKFPEATFVITAIRPYDKTVTEADDPRLEKLNEYKVARPTHMVSGNLTIKGIEKNIEFPAAIAVNGNTAEARAKFNLDRKQWNIVYTGKPDDLIRDEFYLGIYLKAQK